MNTRFPAQVVFGNLKEVMPKANIFNTRHCCLVVVSLVVLTAILYYQQGKFDKMQNV